MSACGAAAAEGGVWGTSSSLLYPSSSSAPAGAVSASARDQAEHAVSERQTPAPFPAPSLA